MTTIMLLVQQTRQRWPRVLSVQCECAFVCVEPLCPIAEVINAGMCYRQVRLFYVQFVVCLVVLKFVTLGSNNGNRIRIMHNALILLAPFYLQIVEPFTPSQKYF